ncbi:MAG TPA: TonB-dependent receptor [Vicinamibacterales bacterium]|nr:TonB-dependent receptor [Vicinamibacterales bacterium]
MSRVLVLALALLAAAPVAAQSPAPSNAPQPVQETVVVTATATPVPFQNLARSVVVLTHDEIARLPVQSVDEVLRYAAGVDVRARGPMGVQDDFSLRGAAFGQTLVLVDGLPINDPQSGHHNGDIPVPLDDIDRVEILYGPGSSLYGADAFGGTVNVITRRQGAADSVQFTAGAFGLAAGQAAVHADRGDLHQTFAFSGTRASGFEPDRDFQTLSVSSGTAIGRHTYLFVSHLRKAFGAYGFYGPAPSREWTNQTLVSLDRQLFSGRAWQVDAATSYRTHGDRFLYDQTVPGFPMNRHRTQEVQLQVKAQRAWSPATRLTLGAAGGGDWIHSNNLGTHRYGQGSLFAELQQRIGGRTMLYPGLRVDHYANFGTSWSPSLAVSSWVSRTVKLRASAGHAFRIPTFTELYYSDPSSQGNPLLKPEGAWSGEAGVDWTPGALWSASATVFGRRDHNVIDFIRRSAQEKWTAANLRDVATEGVQLSVRRLLPSAGLVQLQYDYLTEDAGTVDYLSEYVLDYARHALSGVASLPLPAGLGLGQRVAYTRRSDGRHYWVVDTRLSKRVGSARVFVDGTNLLNSQYQEIHGVDMPGRWLSAGIQVGEGRP